MADYINKQAFLDYMKRTDRYFNVKFDIENFPNADVAPVRHGKWIIQDNIFTRFKWSACGYENHKGNEKYCSNCGTKMNLEVNNVLEGK